MESKATGQTNMSKDCVIEQDNVRRRIFLSQGGSSAVKDSDCRMMATARVTHT
jgi:hypothetical protein